MTRTYYIGRFLLEGDSSIVLGILPERWDEIPQPLRYYQLFDGSANRNLKGAGMAQCEHVYSIEVET